jgi:predicted PurR-regulated permease PerM
MGAEATPERARGMGPLATAATVVLVVAGLKLASDLLVPIVLAAFLAMACIPLVRFLRRRGLPPGVAVAVTIVLVLALVLGLAFVVVDSFSEFARSAPRYQERLEGYWHDALAWARSKGLDLAPPDAPEPLDPKRVLEVAASVAGTAAGAFSTVFLTLLLTIFTLFESLGLPNKIRRALGRNDVDLSGGQELLRKVYGYIAIKTVLSLLTGVLFGAALGIIGVDSFVLWGFLAFVFNFIPNIGSVLAAIPPIFIAMVQPDGGPGLALGALAANLAVNQVIGNVVEPKVTGDRLGLSAFVVFLSLVVWAWIWGPVGMLLSVPLTMVLKILLEHSPSTRPIAALLGPAGTPDPLPASGGSSGAGGVSGA